MKTKFCIEDYLYDRYFMACATYEEAEIFTKYLASVGKRWRSGDSYENEMNFKYEKGTGYLFNMGEYASTEWYINNDYCVLYFNDFDWSHMGYNTETIDDEQDQEEESVLLSDFIHQFATK